jgi:cytochrome c553
MRALSILAALVALLCASACDPADDSLEDLDTNDMEPPPDPDLQSEAMPRRITTNGCANTFDFEKELVIRELAVVEDPVRTTGAGVWTFGHLVAELSGARDPKALAKEWLQTWTTSPRLDGERVDGNASTVQDVLIGPWNESGFALAKAPFRLLVIALRPEVGDGAELRFIYGATSPAGTALPMTVAFEYAITSAFMVRWHETLAPLAKGSAAYRDALALLTEEAIHDATKTNGSSLKQLRTNEAAIDFPWDLREFRLSATAGGTLARARLAGQPKVRFDGDARLATGVTSAMETYQAIIPSEDFAWNVPGMGAQERRRFALTTCAGCHSRETNTRFTHIKPREAGKRADLSAFLQSRTCEPADAACKRLEASGQFTDPITPFRFTVQDDRMVALNTILAAASSCE